MFDFSFQNILHSNLINFAVMVAIIAWLCLKMDISNKLEQLRLNIENNVKNSDLAKENARSLLKNTLKSVENLGQEIETIQQNATTSAEKLAEKIKNDTQNQIDKLEQNTQKSIKTQSEKVQGELKQEISYATIELAEEKIKNSLNNDENLHKKLIDESIEKLDKAEF